MMQGAQNQYWRQVPKVNVLGNSGRTPPRVLILKVLLIAIVILGAILIWQLRGNTSDANVRIEAKTSELRRLTAELKAKKQDTELLETGIIGLRKEHDDMARAFSEFIAGGTDWHGAFSDLFESDPPGIEFGSVIGEPGGRIILGGFATDEESIVRLPTQMSSISESIDFHGIEWLVETDPPSFIATFQVQQ